MNLRNTKIFYKSYKSNFSRVLMRLACYQKNHTPPAEFNKIQKPFIISSSITHHLISLVQAVSGSTYDHAHAVHKHLKPLRHMKNWVKCL